jgi:hypothetical protein
LAFEEVDKVIGAIGQPLALKSYRPFHTTGEDFLQSYLGTAGIPMEIETHFPEDEPVVLLTQEAAKDKDIVSKIEKHVRTGHTVVITSGLLKALQSRGIQQIAEIEDTGRVASVKTFQAHYRLFEGEKSILIPQIGYRTNDSSPRSTATTAGLCCRTPTTSKATSTFSRFRKTSPTSIICRNPC